MTTITYTQRLEQERLDDVHRLEDKQARPDANLFHAFSNPLRLRILRLLVDAEVPLLSMDIMAHFTVEQPTVAHHMKILRDAGLIDYEQFGIYHHYSIVAERMRYAASLLAALVPPEATQP